MRFFRVAALVCAFAMLLCGCSAAAPAEKNMYTATFLTVFDTLTTIKGPADGEEAFSRIAQDAHDELLRYHQLFDIYQEYPGIVNLKTVNDRAGTAPVEVDPDILQMLQDCKTYYTLTDGLVNPAMGTVLQLWHQAREDGTNDPVHAYLPDPEELALAAGHTSMEDLILNDQNSTVFFRDPALKLDVGAVAKGWAAQRAAKKLPEGFLLSVGGNVVATGPKDASGSPWVIGVENPDGGAYLNTVYLSRGSMVTSGDYQRYYMVDGVRYHHIIDPQTLSPTERWRSVTVVCPDSGLADALSTALFLMPREAGEQLALQHGAEAMWVDRDGTIYYSSGFSDLIRT